MLVPAQGRSWPRCKNRGGRKHQGLDINPVSLQLAASQLTAGNHEVRYKKMGLWQMPYGPDKHNPDKLGAGTLELLGQQGHHLSRQGSSRGTTYW